MSSRAPYGVAGDVRVPDKPGRYTLNGEQHEVCAKQCQATGAVWLVVYDDGPIPHIVRWPDGSACAWASRQEWGPPCS